MSLDEVVEKEIRNDFNKYRFKNILKNCLFGSYVGYMAYILKLMNNTFNDINLDNTEILIKSSGLMLQAYLVTRLGQYVISRNEKRRRKSLNLASRKVINNNMKRIKLKEPTLINYLFEHFLAFGIDILYISDKKKSYSEIEKLASKYSNRFLYKKIFKKASSLGFESEALSNLINYVHFSKFSNKGSYTDTITIINPFVSKEKKIYNLFQIFSLKLIRYEISSAISFLFKHRDEMFLTEDRKIAVGAILSETTRSYKQIPNKIKKTSNLLWRIFIEDLLTNSELSPQQLTDSKNKVYVLEGSDVINKSIVLKEFYDTESMSRELTMYDLAKNAVSKISNLSIPDIVYINNDRNLEVLVRFKGITLKDDSRLPNYQEIVQKLAEFHKYTRENREEMSAYEAVKNKNLIIDILAEDDLEALLYVNKRISQKNKNPCVLYKDAHANNWLITDEGFVMIDFEYKGNAPVQFDLSKLLDQYENNLSLEDKYSLLKLYAMHNSLVFDQDFIEVFHYSRIILGINFALGVIDKSYGRCSDVNNYLNNSLESIDYLQDQKIKQLSTSINKILERLKEDK